MQILNEKVGQMDLHWKNNSNSLFTREGGAAQPKKLEERHGKWSFALTSLNDDGIRLAIQIGLHYNWPIQNRRD